VVTAVGPTPTGNVKTAGLKIGDELVEINMLIVSALGLGQG
jgi:hypothetical protein